MDKIEFYTKLIDVLKYKQEQYAKLQYQFTELITELTRFGILINFTTIDAIHTIIQANILSIQDKIDEIETEMEEYSKDARREA